MARQRNQARKTLTLRLHTQRAELGTCTTDAMRKCVQEAIQDTERQLAQLDEDTGR